MLRRVALAVVMLALQSGCIGIPFMLPPTRVEVGTGFRKVEGVARSADPPPRVAVTAPVTTDHPIVFAAGVHPLGFGRQLLERRVDLGVGYTYQGGPLARIHGAFLEGQGVLGEWRVGPDTVFRAGARTQLRVLGETTSSLLGRGASFGGFIELATFGSGEFGAFNEDGGVVGLSGGEGGFGLAVDGGYAQIDQLTVTTLTASLTVRIPIVVGFAFKWLWALDKK